MTAIVENLRACAGAVLAPQGSFIAAAVDPRVISARLAGAADALDRVFVGGNHLGLVIGTDHPPYTATHDEGREHYYSTGHNDLYEVWCCWKAIMEAARSDGLPTLSDKERGE